MSEKEKPIFTIADEKPVRASDDLMKTYLVKVSKTGVPEEEYKIPITVNTCSQDTGGKREFYHMQDVRLTRTQLEILRNGVRDSRLEIPKGSGIYEKPTVSEQMAAARSEFPGYEIERNASNGLLTAVMHKPRFHIEYLEENPFIQKRRAA